MKKICITDSGYGGLTVCADLVQMLQKHNKGAEIIYFNACYADELGYNAMSDRKTKIKMFDRVLWGIKDYCSPDEILVACNTLSTLIEDTTFNKKNTFPIKSIIDIGIALIQKTLADDEKITIFGTETTVSGNTYLDRLLALGWDKDRITQIACPGLQTAISNQDQVEIKVEQFVRQAPKTSWYFLACTHFGIRSDAFNHSKILNPNLEMAKLASEKIQAQGSITMNMVSRYPIPAQEKATWLALLKEPGTKAMLNNHRIIENLF
jgi:glutamate racemase